MNIDNLFTKEMGSEVEEGKGFVYFSVIEGANNDKVENVKERSTTDGVRAIVTNIYAVPNMPDTFSKSWEYETKPLSLWRLHSSGSRQANTST